ncbi:MAG: serine/threonine protein kinase [Planctomycetes bacterium]|nr:serine/threonine protein kinase [Planctomycetota bacterium]
MNRPPNHRTENLADPGKIPGKGETTDVPLDPQGVSKLLLDETGVDGEEEGRQEIAGLPNLTRYEVQEEIGKGGMGRVLEVRDKTLRREVALKVMLTNDRTEQSRFALEAQITGQLDHPNVLPVYDYGLDDEGKPFFTMKLVRGHSSIADLISDIRKGEVTARRWTFKRRVQVIQEVCQALHYAHMRGVAHRDIKPENIVLGGFGEVYLVDWGVACLGDKAQVRPVDLSKEEARVVRETDARNIVGTPIYMSPEVIRGGEANAESDVYSLVAVLFEFLTLHHYLVDLPDDVQVLADQICSKGRTAAEGFVDPIAGRVPRTLSALCLNGLGTNPEKRFVDARQLEDHLQAWIEGKNPIICPGTCMQRGMNESRDLIDQHPVLIPALVITLSVLALAWIGYTTWFFIQSA